MKMMVKIVSGGQTGVDQGAFLSEAEVEEMFRPC